MFHIVIGQSGAGKTTYVKTEFLRGEPELVEDIVPMTKFRKMYALGKYGIGVRTEGTDTLPYNAKEKIKKQLKKLAAENAEVVLEGDRINNSSIFDYIATLGVKTELILVTCSVGTSMQRLRCAGSKITPTFVRATKTKSRNMFLKYSGKFKGRIVKTD